MNQLTTFAHAGHVHAEKELAMTPMVSPVVLAAGAVILVAVIVLAVVLSQRGSKATVTETDVKDN